MGVYCKYHLARGVLSALADSVQVLIVRPDKGEKCSVEGCGRRVHFKTVYYPTHTGIVFTATNQTSLPVTGTASIMGSIQTLNPTDG